MKIQFHEGPTSGAHRIFLSGTNSETIWLDLVSLLRDEIADLQIKMGWDHRYQLTFHGMDFTSNGIVAYLSGYIGTWRGMHDAGLEIPELSHLLAAAGRWEGEAFSISVESKELLLNSPMNNKLNGLFDIRSLPSATSITVSGQVSSRQLDGLIPYVKSAHRTHKWMTSKLPNNDIRIDVSEDTICLDDPVDSYLLVERISIWQQVWWVQADSIQIY